MKRILSLLGIGLVLGSCQYASYRPDHHRQRWFLDTKDFEQRDESMALSISSAEIHENKVRLYVHVTDTGHRFYRGIPTEAFCNTSVWHNYYNQQTIENIRATEYKQVNRPEAAVAFVLDYSGSMGTDKKHLYEIMHRFIDLKREKDAYSIVRYANYASLDVPLSSDRLFLKNEFLPDPKMYIGNLTATWDAITEGIASLDNAQYQEKILVVLTDGGENASQISQQWAIWNAKKSGVKIVAISLRQSGSTNMKYICEQTGGMYTYINHVNELQSAFTDFINKQNSYYLLEFETPIVGKQTVQVNLCNNIALYGQYTFNNSPLGEEPEKWKTAPPRKPSVSNDLISGNDGGTATPPYTPSPSTPYIPPSVTQPTIPTMPPTTPSTSGNVRVPVSTGTNTHTGGGRVPVNNPGSYNTGGGKGTIGTSAAPRPASGGSTRIPVANP